MIEEEIKIMNYDKKWFLIGKNGFIFYIFIGIIITSISSLIQIHIDGIDFSHIHNYPSVRVPIDKPLLIYLLPNQSIIFDTG